MAAASLGLFLLLCSPGLGEPQGAGKLLRGSEPARDGPSTRENRRSVAAPAARRLLDGRGDGF